MNASVSYKITVCVEPRDDGGIRVWSEDLPELVLSHSDSQRVVDDVLIAIRTILTERLGGSVLVQALDTLPPAGVREAPPIRPIVAPASLEFAAYAA